MHLIQHIRDELRSQRDEVGLVALVGGLVFTGFIVYVVGAVVWILITDVIQSFKANPSASVEALWPWAIILVIFTLVAFFFVSSNLANPTWRRVLLATLFSAVMFAALMVFIGVMDSSHTPSRDLIDPPDVYQIDPRDYTR